MERRNDSLPAIILLIAIAVTILDSKTAIQGAAEGINLCISTVIPSLFPLMVLSAAFTSAVNASPSWLLRPMQRLLKIPKGAESLLITGLIGGYPVGAKCISDRYRSGELSEADGKRMLLFCNNAGPAFLFGMCGALFSHAKYTMVLWLIHILSALLSGWVLSRTASPGKCNLEAHKQDVSALIQSSLKAMGIICSWVVLFRVLLGFCNSWFFWLLPQEIAIVITGLMELTNGCCALISYGTELHRFLLSSVLLAFGGLCVTMQTAACAPELFTYRYLLAKMVQACFSLLLSLVVAPTLFPKTGILNYMAPLSLTVLAGIFIFLKVRVEIPRRIVYNTENIRLRGATYAVSKKN